MYISFIFLIIILLDMQEVTDSSSVSPTIFHPASAGFLFSKPRMRCFPFAAPRGSCSCTRNTTGPFRILRQEPPPAFADDSGGWRSR